MCISKCTPGGMSPVLKTFRTDQNADSSCNRLNMLNILINELTMLNIEVARNSWRT